MTTRQNAHQLALKAKGVRQKSFRFPSEVWERLSALAQDYGKSEAEMVRYAIMTAPANRFKPISDEEAESRSVY